MDVVKRSEAKKKPIAPGRTRYLAHTDNLMVAVIDFEDGPTSRPDPPHAHPHEQVTYVAEGDILFFLGDESFRLGPGDMYTVPPDKPHSVQLLSRRVRLIDAFTPLRQDFLK
ncbi:MAG: cupin domain-containing protein [Thermodesulfobacteriota bacterium]